MGEILMNDTTINPNEKYTKNSEKTNPTRESYDIVDNQVGCSIF